MTEETKNKQRTFYHRQDVLRKNPTPSEILFKKRLDDAGIKYIFQKGFIAGEGYSIVDFYLPKPRKICIEIDGGYHQTLIQKYKDGQKDRYLEVDRGFKVIRINNEDVMNFDLTLLNQ